MEDHYKRKDFWAALLASNTVQKWKGRLRLLKILANKKN